MDAEKTFSVASDAYASWRPQYPPELFDWIASHCTARGVAWDCATGNGQAALGLAPHFERIEATDVSAEQIKNAFPSQNISYSVQSAEVTKFAAATFDLVTVAQALHWFDLRSFWAEVRRTAKPGSFFCAWGYAWFEYDEELESSLFTPLRRILEPYWAPANGLLWRGYRHDEIMFPFQPVEAPSFTIEVRPELEAIIGYIRTWSAYKRANAFPSAARSLAELEDHAFASFQSRRVVPAKSKLAVVAGRNS